MKTPMKFEDLKIPRMSVSLTMQENIDAVAHAVWQQMRDHYENPASAWRLPDPPPGQRWHRTDWTQDMLPEGYRPLLLGEVERKEDEFFSEFLRWWVSPPTADADGAQPGDYHRRTRRPLPAPVEYVPLGQEDVPPGSAVRYFGKVEWQAVLEIDQHMVWTRDQSFSWGFLADHCEILRPGSSTWEPCKKPKA